MDKKAVLVIIVICFLFYSTAFFQEDHSPIDQFLSRKTEVMQQWTQGLSDKIGQITSAMKDKGVPAEQKDIEAWWDDVRQWLDGLYEGQQERMEELRKDYDAARGIREM